MYLNGSGSVCSNVSYPNQTNRTRVVKVQPKGLELVLLLEPEPLDECCKYDLYWIIPKNNFLGDPPDPARASEGVARGVCVALLPGLATLKSSDLSPLAIRVSTQPDNVSNGAVLCKNKH